MGHDNVVSGHLKSTGIMWVDELSMRTPEFGVPQCYINVMGMLH